jgi:uncharacterized surface protein with fasciclin (FAS1) repeats
MRITTKLAAAATAVAFALVGAVAAAPAASAGNAAPPGTKPLAEVLVPNYSGFDHNKWNYNIVTNAVLAVLQADPKSPVAVLADGTKPVTAFIPRDIAFYRLAKALTGTWPKNEQAAFNVVAGLGIPTVEAVLEYHIVPGLTIDSATALQSDGATLPTLLKGQTFTVNVINRSNGTVGIELQDANPNFWNPWVALTQLDINKGNVQIAHGIGRVLMPAA